MIRSQTISGPYVRKAIESIQSFLLGEVLLGDPQHTRDALDEIVTAVTRCVSPKSSHRFASCSLTFYFIWSYRCRFVLTDVVGDEMVQLHMLETLRVIVNTANVEYVDDSTHWNILHFCCLNLAKTGETH